MATFAGAFGGLLAYGIGFMKNIGGFANGWHWIFILGIYTLDIVDLQRVALLASSVLSRHCSFAMYSPYYHHIRRKV